MAVAPAVGEPRTFLETRLRRATRERNGHPVPSPARFSAPAATAAATSHMDWYKRFKSKACILKLKGQTKEDILNEIADQLLSAKLIDGDLEGNVRSALIAREELASTGVGMNVAIPHVKVEGLSQALFSLSVSKDGCEWQAVDGAPVHIIFTVLRPEEATETYDPDEHLAMMRWVAKLARDSDFRAFALQAKTKTELVGLLKEMSVA